MKKWKNNYFRIMNNSFPYVVSLIALVNIGIINVLVCIFGFQGVLGQDLGGSETILRSYNKEYIR